MRVVREDPERRGLLYAGTETGVYVSFDDGARGSRCSCNLPVVPITDLRVQGRRPRRRDAGPLVLDPRRHLGAAPVEARARGRGRPSLPAAPAYRFGGGEGRGAVGKNPPYGASDPLPAQGGAEGGRGGEARDPGRQGSARPRVQLEGREERGEGRRETTTSGSDAQAPKPLPAKAGLNRFAWDLRYPEASKFKGMILWAGQTARAARRAGPLPGAPHGRGTDAEPAVRGAQGPARLRERRGPREAARAAAEDPRQAHGHARRDRPAARRARPGEAAAERAKGSPAEKAVQEAADALGKKLTAVEEALYQTKNQLEPGPAQLPDPAQQQARRARGNGRRAPTPRRPRRPTPSTTSSRRRSTPSSQTLERVLAEDVPAFNRLVREKEIPAVQVPKP